MTLDPRRARRSAPTRGSVLGVAVIAALVGCGGGGSVEPLVSASTSTLGGAPGDPTSEPPETQDPTEPAEPTWADCLEGAWALDVADYAAQSLAFMAGLGVPITSLEAAGTQIVTFTGETVGVDTDLTWTAVVAGQTIGTADQSSGVGTLVVGESDFEVSEWIWGVAPGDTADALAALPTLSFAEAQGVNVVCTDSTLELNGAGAPLVGRFVSNG